MQQVFYNCQNLNYEEKMSLMKEAKAQSFSWWVDHLDCSISIQRKRTNMSWEDIIKKFKNSDHFVCIQRGFPDFATQKYYGEIGFSTSDGYYLYLLVELALFSKIIKQYQLKEM